MVASSSEQCCAQPAADEIQKRVPGFTPKLGIVLGSGMGDVAKCIEEPVVIPYSSLPGFPVSTVSGHAGNLVLGRLGGISVACLQGRVHLYEGIDPEKVQVYIYALRLIGCEVLFLTSAVGSLVPENDAGTLVLLKDHINLMGRHPLIGGNDPIGPRFPSMLGVYDPKLRALLGECARIKGLRLPHGVYCAVSGPSFETPAEIRAFRTLGADVVGMSMVPEVLCARHCGMRVAAVSIVVNLASGIGEGHISHDDTLLWTNRASEDMKTLLMAFISRHDSWDEDICKQIVSVMDVASLEEETCDEAAIRALMDDAVHDGHCTAGICVLPKFVSFVKSLKQTAPRKYPAKLRISTTANFPAGAAAPEQVVAEAVKAVQDGADEIDVVVDYNLLNKDREDGRKAVETLVVKLRAACPATTLKVIIESGELKSPELIAVACDAALEGGADFLKTSTGKAATANFQDAMTILQRLAVFRKTHPDRVVGFMPAGKIRTVTEAKRFLALAAEVMLGSAEARASLDASVFRIGSSGLLPEVRSALRHDAGAVSQMRTAQMTEAHYRSEWDKIRQARQEMECQDGQGSAGTKRKATDEALRN